MQIQIIAVGKLKEKYLTEGIAEYGKRIAPYAKLRIVEIPDEKAPELRSETEQRQIVEREGERILGHLRGDAHVIAMAIDGELWTSEQLANHLSRQAAYGQSQVVFVIGGSLGLSDAVLRRADVKLSFGRVTYPHQLMRLILTEQIYRAFKIIRGEPYHR